MASLKCSAGFGRLLTSAWFGFASLGLALPVPLARAAPDTTSFRLVWREPIGYSSGTPVVSKKVVLLGSNNRRPRIAAIKGDHGVVLCFQLDTGAFLGQVPHAKLPHRSNDLGASVRCRPWIDSDRAYYTNNRGELVCLDITAFAPKAKQKKIVWSLDFVGALGVFKRDASDVGNPLSSPLVVGDLVYAITGNGAAFGFARNALPEDAPYVPKPDAPSFVAVNKKTGKLVWSSAAPGKNIQYGQWASPAHAKVGDTDQILFPGGDGQLYGLDAKTGKVIWKVDCNPASATRWDGDKLGTRVSFLAAPVVREGVAYIGTAIDLERTDVLRPLYAVEVTHKGDATRHAIKWTFHDDDFGGTFGQVALGKDTLYALGGSGDLVCLNPKTGKLLWRSDLGADAKYFGSPVVNGNIMIAAAGRKLFLFADNPKRTPLGEYRFDDYITATPTVFKNKIIVPTRQHLYCLEFSLPVPRKR
jgi:outer membrane protein assembly factor BamB